MRSTVAFHARGTTGGLGYFLSFFHLHYANYEHFSARDVIRLEIARLIQFCHEATSSVGSGESFVVVAI